MRAMGWMLLVLWPMEVIRLLFGVPLLAGGASVLFAVYLALAIVVAGYGNRLLAGVLLLGITILVVLDGAGSLAVQGLSDAMVFAAFLPAVFLLRNVLAGDRRLLAYRQTVEAVDANQQTGMLLVGSHVLGSALTVGALAILSPVVPPDAEEARRRAAALATIFGISLSVLWSPVFVAMAVVSEFMPHVPLWKPILVGLSMAVLGTVTALVFLGVCNKGRLVVRAVIALRAIIPWVALTAVVVVVVRSVTSLSTVEAASLTLLPLAAAFLLVQPRANQRVALKKTRQSLDVLGAEISIVALAFALGTVMRDSPTVQQLVQGLFGPEIAALFLIAMIVAGMLLAAMIGGHPIVSASILLAVFSAADTALTDLILCGAVLLGWACSAMIAPAGLIVIVATGMFQIDRRSIIFSRNTLVVLLFASLGILALTAVNAVIA